MTDATAIMLILIAAVISEEHRAKLSAAKLGKKLPKRSSEHCKKISEGLFRAWERRNKDKNDS
jgi:hypothetical protein